MHKEYGGAMSSSSLLIANFKMQFSFTQTIKYIEENPWQSIAVQTNTQLVICPSFETLASVFQLLTQTSCALGAQDCSEYMSGPYTGQVSAKSLAEVGCTFCIIGHSESKTAFRYAATTIAQKMICLLKMHIIPIVCIGEHTQPLSVDALYKALDLQLHEILSPVAPALLKRPWYIAYEPVWAIGTGLAPTVEQVSQVCALIQRICVQYNGPSGILYGGSITEKNASSYKAIPSLNGLLIGNASLDFKKFENIVLS